MSDYNFKYDLDKALQAVAVLLKQTESGTYDYYRLIKILYIADMESLKESGYPITGSSPCAMDHGPALSEIYDELKEDKDDKWHQYIEGIDLPVVGLKNDPGKGKLSPFELDKLEEVWEKHKDKEFEDFKELTHEFYEQKKNQPPKGNSNPIPLSDILRAPRINLSEYREEIEENAKDTHEFDEMIST